MPHLQDRAGTQGRLERWVLVADARTQAGCAWAEALEQAGYTLLWAQDGVHAAAQLHAHAYAAVLLGDAGHGEAQLLAAVAELDDRVPVLVLAPERPGPPLPQLVRAPTTVHAVLPADAARMLQLLGERGTGAPVLTHGIQAPAFGLVGELDLALAALHMAYQPIVDLSARRLHGYEALVRCGPGNLSSPPALLAAAESLGRLQALSRQIRAQIALDMHGAAPVRAGCLVYVNLHAQDLLDAQLFDAAAPLSAHARQIVLEITERTPLEEIPDVLARIGRLRAMGYRIALDDLGAGYAGLSTFAQLEPEVVKLDMALVREVETSRTKGHIVASMVQLCAQLGMQVIAEGVETRAERDALRSLGCQLLQGYLFGRPERAFEPPSL